MSKIVLKKSSVASKITLVTDLDYGELALNYTDGKLFFKNNSNTIDYIGSGNSLPSQTGNNGKILSTNGSSLSWITNTVFSGSYADLTNKPTLFSGSYADLTNKPTTLSGYGITDAQALDADLTAIAALAGTSGLLKKTAANTWALDTSTYLTSITSSQVTTALGYTPLSNAISYLPLTGGNLTGDLTLNGDITLPFNTLTAYATQAEQVNAINLNVSSSVYLDSAWELYYNSMTENLELLHYGYTNAAQNLLINGNVALHASNYSNYAQPTLVSGTNIKTINGTSLLGSGDIEISAGSQQFQNRYSYTANGGQTTFSAEYLSPYVDVYQNGVKLGAADYTATSGTDIVLATAAVADDLIEIIGYSNVAAGGGGGGSGSSVPIGSIIMIPDTMSDPVGWTACAGYLLGPASSYPQLAGVLPYSSQILYYFNQVYPQSSSASSFIDVRDSSQAHDGDYTETSGGWHSAIENMPWLQFNLGVTEMVDAYTIWGRTDGFNIGYDGWVVYGSTDGVNFTAIDTRGSMPIPNGGSMSFAVQNPGYYQYYRIQSNTSYYQVIGEWQLFTGAYVQEGYQLPNAVSSTSGTKYIIKVQ